MKNTRVSLFININKSQIIDNGDYFEIRGVPVTKDDAVMNELHYPGDENKAGMPTLNGRIVTLSHPVNKNGEGADAYEPDSLMEHFSGGTVRNVYNDEGTWKVDIRIKKNLLKAQDESNGTEFFNRLENKEDIGVSTGLYTEAEEKIGTNKEGKKYKYIARKQNYNHLAMLEASEPPAGGEDTFMRFNSDENVEKMVVNLSDHLTDNSSGLDFTEGHRAKMDKVMAMMEKAIRSHLSIDGSEYVCVTDWNDNSIVFYQEGATKVVGYEAVEDGIKIIGDPVDVTPAAVYSAVKNAIDYMPEASYKRVDTEEEGKKEDVNMLLKILQILGLSKLFANKEQSNYNNGNSDLETNEDQDMADMKKMKAALKEAGKLKDNMTEDEVKNAYAKLNQNADEGSNDNPSTASNDEGAGEAVSNADVLKRLEDVEARNAELEAKLNAQSDSEKEQIVNELESADIGLDKDDLESMEINALKKLHAKHCSVTNSLGRPVPNTNSTEGFDEMPEMEV